MINENDEEEQNSLFSEEIPDDEEDITPPPAKRLLPSTPTDNNGTLKMCATGEILETGEDQNLGRRGFEALQAATTDLSRSLSTTVDLPRELPTTVDLTRPLPTTVDQPRLLPTTVGPPRPLPTTIDLPHLLATAVDLPRPLPSTADDCYYFGNMVTSKLRLFDESVRCAIQSEILNIFRRAHAGYYNNPSFVQKK